MKIKIALFSLLLVLSCTTVFAANTSNTTPAEARNGVIDLRSESLTGSGIFIGSN